MLPSRSLPLVALVTLLAFPAAALAVDYLPAEAIASATKTVKVADDFYSPKRLTVAKGTTIKWVWSSRNADSHDVYLKKKPKGVKRFQSAPAATSYSFKRKLKKAGTYKLLCTFHEGMTMRIKVKS
jgi:plastocyanin